MNALLKYDARADTVNSLLCVGLDTAISRLPAWAGERSAPQLSFNQRIIDLTAEYVAAFKFNMSFYEETGSSGLRQLAGSLDYLRSQHPNILTISDAKRADIGNSSAAYARAIFEELGFDAVTLSPYLGQDALQPFLDYGDKACIILCRTSNPGSAEFQNLEIAGVALWQHVAKAVSRAWNARGNCMLVAAATYPAELAQIRAIVGDMSLLVPGIGAQGGDIASVIGAGLNSRGKGLIINASRSIIFADDPADAAATLRDTINQFRPR